MKKRITVAMAKKIAIEKDTSVIDELIPIIMDSMISVGNKMIGHKTKKMKDVDPQLMVYGLMVIILLSKDLTNDRKRKFMDVFLTKIAKEAMTTAAYEKYGEEIFGRENFWDDFPEMSNEDFDEWIKE